MRTAALPASWVESLYRLLLSPHMLQHGGMRVDTLFPW